MHTRATSLDEAVHRFYISGNDGIDAEMVTMDTGEDPYGDKRGFPNPRWDG